MHYLNLSYDERHRSYSVDEFEVRVLEPETPGVPWNLFWHQIRAFQFQILTRWMQLLVLWMQFMMLMLLWMAIWSLKHRVLWLQVQVIAAQASSKWINCPSIKCSHWPQKQVSQFSVWDPSGENKIISSTVWFCTRSYGKIHVTATKS